MNAFEEKTLRYIHRHMPAVANGKILTAVSGGADSVAMLRVLAALGCNCIAAHCNFHLRGDEADRDEAFVRKLCLDIDIELRCTDFDVEAYKKSHGVSTEMAANCATTGSSVNAPPWAAPLLPWLTIATTTSRLSF